MRLDHLIVRYMTFIEYIKHRKDVVGAPFVLGLLYIGVIQRLANRFVSGVCLHVHAYANQDSA